METKMIAIPFDLERAKRIQEGKEEGKITTRDGSSVRIICWDVKGPTYCLIALITLLPANCEICKYYDKYGHYNVEDGEGYELDNHALVLRVPEYTQYKDGDILISRSKYPFIYKRINNNFCDCYVGINSYCNLVFNGYDMYYFLSEIEGYANEEQRQQLINALQDSKEPLAKEYLKRFFNIEKEEFKPFDRVLVKDNNERWICSIFSHKISTNTYLRYVTISGRYNQCIPYNEETKHLLGTDKPYIK